MSIEQAINDHAAAIRELVAAMISAGQMRGAAVMTAAADTIEQDVAKVEADAKRTEYEIENGLPAGTSAKLDAEHEAKKAAQQKAMDKVEADKTTAKAAIAKQLAEVAAQKAEAAKPTFEADPLDESPVVELSYENDVKKKLVAVGKNKQEMVDLLKDFGVGAGLTYEKADKLPKEKYADVVAACDKILAARG